MSATQHNSNTRRPSEQQLELDGHGRTLRDSTDVSSSENSTDDEHGGDSELDCDRTLMYGGEFIEDIRPLVDQNRLTVVFNGMEYTPPYIHIDERVQRHKVPLDDSVPREVDGIEYGDKLYRLKPVGFEIEVQFGRMLGPTDLGDGGMGVRCLGLTFMGVHEQWSSHNCQIADYAMGTNEDGRYELTLHVDEFNRDIMVQQ